MSEPSAWVGGIPMGRDNIPHTGISPGCSSALFPTRMREPRLVDLRHLDTERNLVVGQSHPLACKAQRGHGTSRKPPSQQAVKWDRAGTVPVCVLPLSLKGKVPKKTETVDPE